VASCWYLGVGIWCDLRFALCQKHVLGRTVNVISPAILGINDAPILTLPNQLTMPLWCGKREQAREGTTLFSRVMLASSRVEFSDSDIHLVLN
jgi:hypothetical protein